MPKDFIYETVITIDHEEGVMFVDTTQASVASQLLRNHQTQFEALPPLSQAGGPAPFPGAEGEPLGEIPTDRKRPRQIARPARTDAKFRVGAAEV